MAGFSEDLLGCIGRNISMFEGCDARGDLIRPRGLNLPYEWAQRFQ